MRRGLRLWSIPLFLVLAGVGLLALSLRGYERLAGEAPVAEIRFTPLDDRLYRARLFRYDRCREESYLIAGDQWRIDARFLKWNGWAAWLGLDARYRLERIEGRYRSLAEERSRPATHYALGDASAFDIVELARALGPLNVLVDAEYGSSTYQAIDPDVVYRVYRSQSGLLSRREPIVRSDGGIPVIEIRPGCRGDGGGLMDRFLEIVGLGAPAERTQSSR